MFSLKTVFAIICKSDAVLDFILSTYTLGVVGRFGIESMERTDREHSLTGVTDL